MTKADFNINPSVRRKLTYQPGLSAPPAKFLSGSILILVALLFMHVDIIAQEFEPRSLTNIPIGMNFTGAGYAFARGNTLMDQALPIEDFEGKINTIVLAYARSVNFWGKSGKVDVLLPFGGGDFHGVFQGNPFEDHFTGIGDIRIRASINFTGAPSFNLQGFSDYEQKTVSGLSVQLIVPTGNYNAEQLPNLGSNRWTIRANYGISQTIQKWILEAYLGVWIFGNNNEFLGDNKLSQTPLWITRAQLTRTLQKGMWLTINLGYGYGAETSVNDIKRDAIVSAMRLGIVFALPLGSQHTLKGSFVSGIRFKQGGDFDAVGVAYQYRWLKKED